MQASPHLRHPRCHRQAGFTPLESLLTLAVSLTVLGTAVPQFERLRDRHLLESAAAQIETDLQHARSAAAARGVSVRMSFESTAAYSCYVVHTGSAGDCRCNEAGDAVCRGSAQAVQSVRWDAATGARLASSSASIVFDADRGTVTPTATIALRRKDHEIRQIVNLMGRIRSCSPAPAVPGHRVC